MKLQVKRTHPYRDTSKLTRVVQWHGKKVRFLPLERFAVFTFSQNLIWFLVFVGYQGWRERKASRH